MLRGAVCALRSLLCALKQNRGARLAVRKLSEPIAGVYLRMPPLESCPAWLGLASDIAVPAAARRARAPERTAAGGANINIILHLLDETRCVPGDIVECGVFRGRTIIPIGLYARRAAPEKQVLGFDSFDGFEDHAVREEIALGGSADRDKRLGGFAETSYAEVQRKVRRLGLAGRVQLVPGLFEHSLPRFEERQFSFIHLDCDLYQSYKTCLEFFYPRTKLGGIVLLDEYNDPPWPGCNLAVDEFLHDKPETLFEIERDNYRKWFFRKL